MSAHAVLSASGSFRWLQCPPSALLERKFTDNTSEAAAKGSAAHALAEHKLRRALKMRSKKPISTYDCDEMDGYTDGYVEFVLEQAGYCPNSKVLIEQKLDISKYVPDGFGTADCIIVADRILRVIDLKYGTGVVVSAEENPQMKLYALGALGLFEDLYDIDDVSMSIYQPRRENVSTYTIDREALCQWADAVLKPTARLAYNGGGEYQPGAHCQFCRAAVRCRARADEQLKLAASEFALPPLLSDDEISGLLGNLDDIVAWANSIKEYALHSALQGKIWEGWKLCEGRSNRRYKDEDAVAKAAQEAGYNDIYKHSLITITDMERLMTKKKFNEILGAFIEKPPGKPVLVPECDKRPELNTAKNDFMEDI